MKMTMNVGPGEAATSAIKQTIDMVWEIESVEENGNAVLTQTIERVQMGIAAPGQAEVQYDSSSEEPPQGYAAMLAPMFQAMISAPFKVTMSPRGEIVDVEVPQSLIEAMSQIPGGAMLGSLATEEGFRNMIRQSSILLPKPEELVEGHQWTSSIEMDNPIAGKIITETTYQYQGPREVEGQPMEVFVPSIETKFTGGEGANSIAVEKQDATGEILFNRQAGRLESSKIVQQMQMVITVGDNKINQNLDQTISFRIVPDAGGQ